MNPPVETTTDGAELSLFDSLNIPRTSARLTSHQRDAIGTLMARIEGGAEEVSLSGHAGTGKTTIIPALQDALYSTDRYPVVVTPTNKAAAVLRSKNILATTLYAKFFSLIESDYGRKLRFAPNWQLDGKLGNGKIAFASTIILDESSMAGSWVLEHLRRMCDTLILIGDANQLPPVGDTECPSGYFCAMPEHDFTLTEVLRNSGEILEIATAFRDKSINPAQVNLDRFYPDRALSFVALMNSERPQIISWTNNTRKRTNMRARLALDRRGLIPIPGDVAMCCSNYSDNLLNGTQVEVLAFEWNPGEVVGKAQLELPTGEIECADVDMAWFFGDQMSDTVKRGVESLRGVRAPENPDALLKLTYGYCITAHKAQGGEWPSVALVDERQGLYRMAAEMHRKNPKQPDPGDQCRRWTYTGITRAQKTLFVVDDSWLLGRL